MIRDILVIIDPGHGGREPGAVSNGLKEKDITLELSLELRKILVQHFNNVILTRETDVYFDLNARAAWVAGKAEEFLKSNPAGKVICLCEHFNALDGTARGCEVIYSQHSGPELSKAIAGKICELGIPFRRVYSRDSENQPGKGIDYYCMHRATGKAQTVIIESLFVDNRGDASLLDRPGFIGQLAQKHAEGLLVYLGIAEPEEKQQEPQHWAKQDHDELMEFFRKAGVDISDHTATLDKPATEGLVFRMLNLMRKAGNING